VKAEMKKMLSEGKVAQKPQSKGISMAKAILSEEPIQESVQQKVVSTKQFSKNPMINQILNETAMAPATGDAGFRTMNFGQGDMGSIVGRTAIAEKMGYGDLAKGPSPSGLGVNTGVPELDKALNRDYSELVKRFKKK
jgi:hypothetical protein